MSAAKGNKCITNTFEFVTKDVRRRKTFPCVFFFFSSHINKNHIPAGWVLTVTCSGFYFAPCRPEGKMNKSLGLAHGQDHYSAAPLCSDHHCSSPEKFIRKILQSLLSHLRMNFQVNEPAKCCVLVPPEEILQFKERGLHSGRGSGNIKCFESDNLTPTVSF